MKTIEFWLQELPEPYKSQAMANMWWEDAHSLMPSLPEALRQAFNWSRSTEGTTYWKTLYETLSSK